MVDRSAPPAQLRLEWVFGYRGHQCRNNLFYTATREVVYFVAGVAVVYNHKQHAQRFYLGHTDDIISLSLHPEGVLVATGQVGEAPFICVWNSETCETVSILKDAHKQGVACVAFNATGTVLASVGLDDKSELIVWDWKKGKSLANVPGHNERIFDLAFNPYEENQLVTCGVKDIKFWTLCGNALTDKKGVFGQLGEIQSILCLSFGSGGALFSGTLNGDIYKWKENSLVENITGAHSGGVFTMYSTNDGYATGSKDGTVALWDTEFKPITRIDFNQHSLGYAGISIRSVCWNGTRILVGTNGGEVFEVAATDKDKPVTIVQGHAEGELWGLATHPTRQMFVTASDDTTVRLWDMSAKSVLSKVSFDVASRSAAFSPDGSQIAVGHSDGSFRVLKGRDLSELVHIHDRKEVVHELKFSPDGALLAVGSNENFVDVYSVVEKFKRVAQCKGATSYITHIDWSEDSQYMQTNTGSGERIFFRVPGGKRVTRQEEIEQIHWHSWTSVLGDEVNGIWEKYTDTTDINASDTNFEHGIIVTGDDFGLVRLFRFPCIKKGAHFRKYTGHSAHVTNIRFASSGSYVISTGGEDHSVFQWRFLPEGFTEAEDEHGSVAGGAANGAQDSQDERSDSDSSDVEPLDSDIEQEVTRDYDRTIYKQDLPKLQQNLKQQAKQDGKAGTARARPSAPSGGLHLSFVHGYRGYDCRNNLFYAQSGEVVYHVAAVGVVYNRETHRQRFYLGHDDDILCLTIHPVRDIVATGQVGRDATVHVWDVEKMEALSILRGEHQRGVCAVAFSADGKKLASVGLDDDHTLVVWDWRKGEKLATTRCHKDKIFEVEWNPLSADQLITVGVRHIQFWTQAGGGFTSKRGTYGTVGKADTQLCVTFTKEPGVVVTGCATGMLYIWQEAVLTRALQAHQGPVFAIHALEKGFVSGGKDGQVCLWDEGVTRCLKQYKIHRSSLATSQCKDALVNELSPIRAVVLGQGKILVGTSTGEVIEVDKAGPIQVLVQGHGEGEVWGLATDPSAHRVATAGDDSTLRVWDLAANKMIAARKLAKPARCAAFSPDSKAVAVGYKDGSFSVVHTSTLEDITSQHHRKEEISDVKFSPGEGKYLAVASHDNFVDIYSVLKTARVGIGKGASSYITHVDWDVTGKLLTVNTGARELLYFEAPRGKRQAIVSAELEKIEWHTRTGVLGKKLAGVWPTRSDVTDVNAADVSADGKLVATGDDFGFVKLFEYPVEGPNAKAKKYNGHSAHVTNVRWSHDGAMLTSVGGADTALMVWSARDAVDAGDGVPTTDAQGIESDSDSEEESGYDSDVSREQNMDYSSKIYTVSALRETTGTKPQQQQKEGPGKKLVSRARDGLKKVVGKKEKPSASNGKEKLARVQDLSLAYVHGYRGFDTRNNLHYLPDTKEGGGIVYHAAGVGVVLHPATATSSATQTFYTAHDDDIVCLALNQNPKFKNIVATGQIGSNPSVHVWDALTKQTLSVMQGFHQIGICSVNFSSSGRYLLTVGLDADHTLAVWRWNDGSRIASGAGHTSRLFVAEFRPDSDTVFVSCGVKHVTWWTVTGGSIVGKKGSVATYGSDVKMQTMLSVAFGPNDATFTGCMSGDVFIWTSNNLTRVVSQVHSGPVFTMFTTLSDGLIVTGGKDKSAPPSGQQVASSSGAVKLWDHEMKRSKTFQLACGAAVVKSVCRGTTKGTILVGTQENEIHEINEKANTCQALIEGHMEGEMWGLAVHPSKEMFATGSDDGTLRIWDLPSKKLILRLSPGAPVRSCAFSLDGTLVAVGMKTGEVEIFSLSTGKSVAKKRDRNKTVSDIRFGPGDKVIAVGTEDHAVDFYSFRVDAPTLKRVGYCKAIPSFVTQIDFSTDGAFVQVCTGAYERLVFAVPDGTQVTDVEKINAITWFTWTSPLGDHVAGIWPKDSTGGDINCAHLSNTGSTLATGDDFGYVKLFDFPCPEKFTKGKKFIGHSAHVTNVRFSHDDRYLISIGGDDCCIFIWKCQ